MAIFDVHHPWVFVFGMLGNLISFAVYLSPVPTFYQVYKKKSTENFQSLPYLVALFSSMLWIYYAFLNTEAYLLITINSFGCVIETIYITLFLAYAPRKAKILTAKLMLSLNLGLFLFIYLMTFLLAKGPNRIRILGWVCVTFSMIVFIAPLSIIRLVMRTRSVEFMPFYLSLFLTLSAIVWFCYGLLLNDFYIYAPNILGFIFGVLQMILYAFYKNAKSPIIEEAKKAENAAEVVIEIVKQVPEILPIEELIVSGDVFKDQKKHEETDQNEKIMEV